MAQLDLGDHKVYHVFDYAGHREYHPTHELLLAERDALFLVMLSLRVPVATREEMLLYWLRFIATRFARESLGSPPSVVVALSHRDAPGVTADDAVLDPSTHQWTSRWGQACVARMAEVFHGRLNVYSHVFVLDCRKAGDAETKGLRAFLVERYKTTVAQAPLVPSIIVGVLDRLAYFRQQLGNWAPLKAMELMVGRASPLLVGDLCAAVLRFMHRQGEIVWLDEDRKLRSLVILNPVWLCHTIIGQMLAPESFPVHMKEVHRGRISQWALQDLYPRNSTEIVQLLESLELCYPVSRSREHFMCPAALRGQADIASFDDDLWPPAPRAVAFAFGRRLVIACEAEMFSAGFFPRLQVHLQHPGMLDLEAGVTVTLWLGAARIVTADGVVECVVQLAPSSRAVDVWLRCLCDPADAVSLRRWQGRCQALMGRLVQKVKNVQRAVCPGAVLQVLALSPTHLRDRVRVPAEYAIEMCAGRDTCQALHPSPDGCVSAPNERVVDLLCHLVSAKRGWS
jgi:hypothetical protein